MGIKIMLLLLLMAVLASARPQHWKPENFPNPHLQTEECRRWNLTGWVCDPDGIIPMESILTVDAILAKIAVGGKPFAQAPCGTSGLKGFPMAVALMHRMYNSPDPAAAATDFAHALQDAWGVGDPACDNGALILFSEFEDQLVVAAGAAVHAILPAVAIASIMNRTRVEVAERRYGAAIEFAVTQIGLALADAVRPHDNPPHDGTSDDDGGGGTDDAGTGSGGSGSDHNHGDSGHPLHWGLLVEELLIATGCISAAIGTLYRQHRRRVRAKSQFQDCRTTLKDIQRDHLAALQQRSGAVQSHCPLCHASLDLCTAPSGDDLPLSMGLLPNTDEYDTDNEFQVSVRSDEELGLRQPLNSTMAMTAAATVTVTAAAAAAAAALDQQRPGVMFPCGHAFCQPCVAACLERQLRRCPVCGCLDNGDVTGANTANNSSSSSSSSDELLIRLRERWECRHGGDGGGGGGTSGGAAASASASGKLGPAGSDVQFPVLVFRVRQLQRQFPQFISPDMANVWERDLREGRDFDAHQMRIFERRNPVHSNNSGLVESWRIMSRSLVQLKGLRIWQPRRR